MRILNREPRETIENAAAYRQEHLLSAHLTSFARSIDFHL